jgi:predicted transcriptional regulator
MKKTITISIPKSIKQRLDRIAKKEQEFKYGCI